MSVKYQVTYLVFFSERLKEISMEGIVKNFDNQKGYGFIETGKGDLFVHFNGILGTGRKTLLPGQKVTCVVVQGIRGPQAAKVAVIEGDNNV